MREKLQGYYLASFGSVSASIFFIAVKGSHHGQQFSVGFLWLIYGFACLISMLLFTRPKEFLVTCNWPTIVFGVAFGLFSIMGNYAIGRALEFSSPSVTVIILRVQVLFVILMGIIFLGEKLRKELWFGCAVSCLGFLLLRWNSLNDGLHYKTILWSLFAAGNFAIANVAIKKWILLLNLPVINFLRLLVGALILPFFINGSINHFIYQVVDMRMVLLAFTAALCGPNLSRLSQMYAMQKLPVSHTILFTMLTPMVTMYLAWLLWDTLPSYMMLAGSSLILGGVMLSTLDIGALYRRIRNIP